MSFEHCTDGDGITFNLFWAEYLRVFNHAECVPRATVIP